jgi:hypothetical protein
MRTPIRRVATLVASLVLAACSSGNVYIVRRAPPPPPPRPRIEPLEITLARPIRGQLVVQTNRPSYVALFEIVPDRGVALLAPSYAHQRTWMLAGLNWVPISWKVQSTMYYGRPSGTAVPARWVYAIASDEPLRLPDEAFHPSYMLRVLGPAAYRGTNPHVTMRAISRAFLPSVIDEAWAEDAYALAATYTSDPYRTVRIYCANRSVYEVPEEMADRAWCPVHSPSGGTVVRSVPTRPDSVVASTGQRMRRRMPETTPVRAPIDRVNEPTRPVNPPVAIENPPPRNDPNKDVKDAKQKDRRGNGNAYGHTDDPTVKGRGIENEKSTDPRRTPDPQNGKPEKDVKVKPEKDTPANSQGHDARREPRIDTPVTGQPQQTQPEKQAEKAEVRQEKQEQKEVRREEKQEEKQVREEQKQEEKAEKAEQKADRQPMTVEPPRQAETPVSKPETKPETKPVQKEEEPPAKAEEKQESKAEAKAEQKEEKAEDKAAGKPDEKAPAKPAIRAPGMKNKP